MVFVVCVFYIRYDWLYTYNTKYEYWGEIMQSAIIGALSSLKPDLFWIFLIKTKPKYHKNMIIIISRCVINFLRKINIQAFQGDKFIDLMNLFSSENFFFFYYFKFFVVVVGGLLSVFVTIYFWLSEETDNWLTIDIAWRRDWRDVDNDNKKR